MCATVSREATRVLIRAVNYRIYYQLCRVLVAALLQVNIAAAAEPGTDAASAGQVSQNQRLDSAPATDDSLPKVPAQAPQQTANEPSGFEQLAPGELPPDEQAAKRGILVKSADWLVDKRDYFSKNLVGAARGMDRFFSREQAEEQRNGTNFQFTMGHTLSKGGTLTPKQKVKLRLDLPSTEDRLKLVFESDPDDTDSLSDKNQELQGSDLQETTGDSDTSAALRFLLNSYHKWRVDLDVGVRTPLPLNTFVRLRGKRTHQLDENWRARMRQTAYYFHHGGFSELSQLTFERKLKGANLFRNRYEAQFKDELNKFEFAVITSTLHVVNDRNALEYSLGILGESQPTQRTTNYYLRQNWRHRLYRDWLFFSVVPELAFPRDDGFRPNPSLTIKLDVIFSELAD